MILSRLHEITVLPIWSPKYHSDSGEWEVWPLVRKVRYASPIIIIDFTKAAHLKGQRFCVKKEVVENSPRGTNGKAQIYRVPFSKLEPWSTNEEVSEIAEGIFDE